MKWSSSAPIWYSGPNALGGAVAVRLKNGFTYQGGEFTLRRLVRAHSGFDAVWHRVQQCRGLVSRRNVMNESGWRDFSPSSLRQIYGDLGWRSANAELHVNAIGASMH